MNRLQGLRTRLRQLRHWRAAIRWGNALAVLVIALLSFWAIAFLLDWTFHFDRWLRAVVLVGWGAALSAVVHRWLWPWLKVRESLSEVALSVERAHDIDSDLVAALEFEEQHSLAWGSPRLTAAVVNYVADFSESLDVYRGFQYAGLPQRAGCAAGGLLLGVVLVLSCPQETRAFWNRFWLGTARYPTHTVITELLINGDVVPVHHAVVLRLALPQGQPLNLAVKLAGIRPTQVTAQVRGLVSGERAQWVLTADADNHYRWQVSQLREAMILTVRAGDAESDRVQVDVVPLPVVDLAWTVTLPEYARTSESKTVSQGTRGLSALQGSKIDLNVVGLNKRLKSVELQLGEQRHSLKVDRTTNPPTWSLPPDTALAALAAPHSYQLFVTDLDGLSPQPPILGEIRLMADRVPRVAVAVVSRKVLPTATPVLTFGVTDDFGIRSIAAQIVVVPMQGEQVMLRETIWPGTQALSAAPTVTVRGEYALSLTSLRLEKGDEVRVTLVAEDERGTFPSHSGFSEPLIFEVTDRNGILESLLEIDQQSAKQLDEIIERELGIGRTTR